MTKWKPISTSLDALFEAKLTHFDAIVIGSGYGGGVSALRLAQSGRTVCVLERGREILPGDYPNTPQKAAKEVQITTAKAGPLAQGSNGLFDIRVNDDMSVVLGCGLGGTSLINANVALEPDQRVLASKRWPREFADPETLKPYFERARQELGSNRLPARYNPNKLKALEVSAKGFGLKVERPPINVTFKETFDTKTKITQPPCNMCGDCCSGCNYGSKNTTLMNYLPRAHAAGATIVTQARVYTIARDGEAWSLVVEDLRGDKIVRRTLTADIVVLAAGSLGSTEILIRSKREGLSTSDVLGSGFSGNGDVLGFGFDAFWNNIDNGSKDPQLPIYGIGAGDNQPDIPKYQPGPCITGVIRIDPDEKDYTKSMVIEEGVAPGAVSLAMPMGLFMQQALNGDFTRFPDVEERLRDAQRIGMLFAGAGAGVAVEGADGTSEQPDFKQMAYEGAASQTQTFLVMSHDKGDGRLEMNGDTDCIVVNWPGVGDQENYINVNAKLEQASDSIWANYLPNPLWRPRFGRKLVTVHPVGGCGMGATAEDGVVNAACQVFKGRGRAVHEGLYVCDGAVIPSSIGLNPLLTITAISERAMDILVRTHPVNNSEITARKLMGTATPKAPVPVEIGLTQRLEGIIQLFNRWRDGIHDGRYDQVKREIIAATKNRFQPGKTEEDNATFWKSLTRRLYDMGLKLGLTEAELVSDIDPALAYVVDILENVLAYVAKGDQIGAAKYLEEECGDFSPKLAFKETMSGYVCEPHLEHAPALSNRYDVAAKYGEAKDQPLVAHFNIVAHSLKKLTESDAHEANLTGEIHCTYLAPEPLVIAKGGKFQLLIAEQGEVETWKMIYSCVATSGGKEFYFHGFKTLARRPGSNWWTDLTTLSVDIYEGRTNKGKRLAAGVITLTVQDLLKQLASVKPEFPSQDDNMILTALAKDAIFWGDLKADLDNPKMRQELLRKLIGILAVAHDERILFQINAYFMVKFAGFFGMLVFRAYGEMLAYLYNFPAQAKKQGKVKSLPPLERAKLRGMDVHSTSHWLPNEREKTLHLTRYDARENKYAMNKTVVLAPGFATRAASFAMETVEENLVDALCMAGYDVWLFDYRSSPLLQSSLRPFNLDDVATQDWPMAVEYIQREAGVRDMQAVVHCMGSMTHLMALLSGMKGIRSVVSSQLTLHPVTNWFNKFKADTYLARMIRDGLPENLLPMADAIAPNKAVANLFRGLLTIDANSLVDENPDEPGKFLQDQVINMLTWDVPFPNDAPCYSPTCHRIFGLYGPVYAHEQLNEDTHNAIQTVFGALSTKPFQHIAEVVRQGIAVNKDGKNVYLQNYENLRMPITFLAGALNQEFMPDTSLRTFNWLNDVNREWAHYYDRQVFPDYAHMDFFLGKQAHIDIYPKIIRALRRHDELLRGAV